MTITVTDVNEAPELTGVVSIDLTENITDLNDSETDTDNVTEGQFTVTDEDADDDVSVDADIKWFVGRALMPASFELTTTGATRTLSFEAMPQASSLPETRAEITCMT